MITDEFINKAAITIYLLDLPLITERAMYTIQMCLGTEYKLDFDFSYNVWFLKELNKLEYGLYQENSQLSSFFNFQSHYSCVKELNISFGQRRSTDINLIQIHSGLDLKCVHYWSLAAEYINGARRKILHLWRFHYLTSSVHGTVEFDGCLYINNLTLPAPCVYWHQFDVTIT